jgi:anthranilate synthase component I
MKKIQLKLNHRKLLADTFTPVSIYLQVRDRFPMSLLLESSDYHGQENSFSYVCCQPYALFKASKGTVTYGPMDELEEHPISTTALTELLQAFIENFTLRSNYQHPMLISGLFGYMSFDAIQYMEDINIKEGQADAIPEILYYAYRVLIAIDHFKNEAHIFEFTREDDETTVIPEISVILGNRNLPAYRFQSGGQESSNMLDQSFIEMVKRGISHCHRGDVFQVVFSRRFKTNFQGDEFNVYRALRSINPSPYLFYFDFGDFKLFGSSPEAHLIIKDREAIINPIAGTFRRTGDDEADAELAKTLLEDEKENAEHVMLVDLARNDLSKHGSDVKVDTFKEVQFYSHVIHLVSKVSGKVDGKSIPVIAGTFPAGTLSGAPKFKALELITEYESENREHYGGAIGFLGFNGDFNHAIMIRSFLSRKGELIYQAGAGIVAGSNPENELLEVGHKLEALRKAIKIADEINR